MRKFLIGALALLLSLPALGQSVVQTGTVTPNHATAWSSSGVIKDAGTSALSKLTTLGVTALGGTPFCVSNGTGSGGTAYSQFCMGLDTSNAYMQINGFNGATALGFAININGTPVPLGTGDVTGAASSVNNDVVAFNGSSGKVIKDTGILYTALPQTSANNVWTGTNTFGNTSTFNGALTAASTGTVTLTPTSTATVTINPNTAGTLDNMTIGATTAKAATVTSLSATGTATVTGATTLNGGLTASGSNVSDVFSPTGSGTVTISPATAGTINNMAIGGSSAGAGSFTTLSASGAATFGSTQTTTGTATFNGALTASPVGANVTLSPTTTGTVTIGPNTTGALDNMVIGNATAAAGHFTTLSTTGTASLGVGLADYVTVTGSSADPTIATNSGNLILAPNGSTVYLNNASQPVLVFNATGLGSNLKPWAALNNGNFVISATNDAVNASTVAYTIARGTTYNVASHTWSTSTVAGTPVQGLQLTTTALTSAVPITGNSFIPSSSSAPANGLYLPSANTPSIAANSLLAASFVGGTNAFIFTGGTNPAVSTNAGNISLGSTGGATTLGDASLTITAAAPIVTNLATDATHTTRTVCQDTSSKALYFGSGSAGVCLGTSSIRFKHDVAPMRDGLNQISALKPVNFYYRPGYGDDGAKRQYGFLAEDVVDVLPEAVGMDKEGRPNSVDMLAIVPVLVHAIQDLRQEVSNLKAQIAANENGVVPAARRTVR